MKLEVAARGRSRVVETTAGSDVLRVAADGEVATVRLTPDVGAECWRLRVGDETVAVRLRQAPDGRLVVFVGAERVAVAVRRAVPVRSRRAAADAAAARVEIRSPMPGLVVAAPVGPGAHVGPGQPVVVLEAMKMHMDIGAPAAGRVVEVRVRPGIEVTAGQVLAVLEPAFAPEAAP